MRKTIHIEGRDIDLVLDGRAPILYRTMFGRDYFRDLQEVIPEHEGEELSNTTKLYDFLYFMAFTADDSIGSELEWLESFDNALSFFDRENEDKKSAFDYLAEMIAGNNMAFVKDHKKEAVKNPKKIES